VLIRFEPSRSIGSSPSRADGESTLKRTLGGWSLVRSASAASSAPACSSARRRAIAERAGPSVTLAFLVAGIGCAFAGLCYAEFASMIPIAGSAYTYSYATMGNSSPGIIGWDLVLEYAVGAATVAIAWSEYSTRWSSSSATKSRTNGAIRPSSPQTASPAS
jgi:APA family basic amino acid/polyamine antiporter